MRCESARMRLKMRFEKCDLKNAMRLKMQLKNAIEKCASKNAIEKCDAKMREYDL